MIRLLTSTLGCQAFLTWMGSEVGQIDAVDMPRAANDYNKERARIDYSLADDTELKFKFFEMFQLCVNRLEAVLEWLLTPDSRVVKTDEEAKVLAYVRSGCLFVYNFHPANA